VPVKLVYPLTVPLPGPVILAYCVISPTPVPVTEVE